MEFMNYLFKGFLHWLSLVLGVLDFKDIGFMWIIIIGVTILALFHKSISGGIFALIKSLFMVSKTTVGFIFLMLFIVYYVYIGIVFEDRISIVLIVISIWLIANDFVKTNMNLLTNSENGMFESLKEISVPVLLLYLQQIIYMFEINNFDNILLVNLSLLIIPIYSILFFILKHFVCFEDIYKKYERKLKFEGHYFMRIFNESLIESGTYKVNRKVLEEFLKDNCLLEYEEMKKKLIDELPLLISKYKVKKENKSKKEKVEFSKAKKILITIWLSNIICLIWFIIEYRFFEGHFSFLYYCCLFVVLIYLWADFMKIKRIENQSDFVIYGFIYIVLVLFIVWYSSSLKVFRLAEMGFIIPILVIVRLRYIKDKFPNFLVMPKISENNFFGMTEEQYYNSLNKNKK